MADIEYDEIIPEERQKPLGISSIKEEPKPKVVKKISISKTLTPHEIKKIKEYLRQITQLSRNCYKNCTHVNLDKIASLANDIGKIVGD